MSRAPGTSFAALGLLLPLLAPPPLGAAVWPDREWETASPESQGLSGTGLDAAAEYAQKFGGGSGCVIRHGYLVKEWGSPTQLADVKSATKGTLGATALGLAVDDGVVKFDDRAARHYPRLGAEKKENVDSGWLGEITVRHLATMTAGFDDGRPPKLVYRPGTSGTYSNDTANMLAELLTLAFKEDLAALVKRRVMDPIGVAPGDWSWRDNQYRPKTVDGLKSREFASGLKITHRALARVGYLYLRDGTWKDQQILSREYVRTATRPTDLPAPWPYYAFYWGSNARGTFTEIPRDTFWALGLGDSVVVVCPSLDVVAVRLGIGSIKSQLGEDPDWGRRVADFFKLVARAAEPPSDGPAVREVRWAPADSIIRLARGSDNWPMTWGDDDALYTAYGDGWGFEPLLPEKLSLGLARVLGSPPDVRGVNIRSDTAEQKGDGKRGKKASGLLMVDGVLYMVVRNAGNAVVAWSRDHGRTWSWADWKFTTSFGCPTFLNFGKDYAGARDGYVYVYSPDADDAYVPADRMVLARVPRDRVRDRDAYEFFRGLGPDGTPAWTKDVGQRGAVLTSPGKCYRSAVSYNPGLKRYLWCQTLPRAGRPARYGLAIQEAAEPWGPWTTVFTADDWDVDAGESCGLPTKWMSAEGTTAYLVFSGNDSFCVRRVTFVRSGEGRR
jgi:CubicO group peptidase (beta-lactamase class C family)